MSRKQREYTVSKYEIDAMRNQTGAGFHQCKDALQYARGRWNDAKDLLRTSGTCRYSEVVKRVDNANALEDGDDLITLRAQLAAAELQVKQWQEAFDRCNDDCAELRTRAERAESDRDAAIREVAAIGRTLGHEQARAERAEWFVSEVAEEEFSNYQSVIERAREIRSPRDGQGAG